MGPGDEALVSTLTFSASVNPIVYLGGRPVLIDSERCSWNIDPTLVAETIERKVRQGKPPKAVIPVHLYGQSADLTPILEVCNRQALCSEFTTSQRHRENYKVSFLPLFAGA